MSVSSMPSVSTTFIPKLFNKPFIVVFDLDECIGSFQFGCLAYHRTQPLMEHKNFPIDDFEFAMEDALENSWIRPGIIHVLKVCMMYRDQNLIKKICLYTNSTDEYNWVTFLVNRINAIADIESKNIFDVVISRNSPDRTKIPESDYNKYGGCQPKFVDDVIRLTQSSADTPVLFYDDRLFNLVPSTTGETTLYCVSAYEKRKFFIEDHDLFLNFIEDTMPDMADYYLDMLYSIPYISGIEKYTDLSEDIKIPNRLDAYLFEKQTIIEFLSPLLANIISLTDSSGNLTKSPESLKNRVIASINEHLRYLQ